MKVQTVNSNSVVNLAWNLTALHASAKLGRVDLARGVARRVAADPGDVHTSLDAVVGSWKDSALRQSVARFGDGERVDLENVIPEVDRLKATRPDVHVRLIERFFGLADAITEDFERRLRAVLNNPQDQPQALDDLQVWFTARLELFRAIRGELGKTFAPDWKFAIIESGKLFIDGKLVEPPFLEESELEKLY